MSKSEVISTIYYGLKPLIPRKFQIWVRGKIAVRKRLLYENVWPIDERSGSPPEGWSGWPGGKQFALVLTHDVETAKGQEKCVQLASLEESLGFRSCFYFVAEEYNVQVALRNYLTEHGFEVGVHGLTHKNNPFRSKRVFQKQAVAINRYLKEWGSVGYRSPCMYRNLEWICDLNIEYDASTFDTDPFEPQPDGVGTIFPFWVPRNTASNPIDSTDRKSQVASREGLTHHSNIPSFHHSDIPVPDSPSNPINPNNSKLVTRNSQLATRYPQPRSSSLQPPTVSRIGYVELPYTLPQDHTLFVVMGEKDINIWKKKLDWIAEKGGMALLLTHPDYMSHTNDKMPRTEYQAKLYKEFLEYVGEQYGGSYWEVLPKEMAQFWKERYTSATGGGNISY